MSQRMRDAGRRPGTAGLAGVPPAATPPFQRRTRNAARMTLDFNADRHRELLRALLDDDRATAVNLFRGLLALALEDPKLWRVAMDRGRLEIP